MSLTAKQQQGALLISQGLTLVEVAKTLKVNTRTLHRWRQEPLFVEALDRLLLKQQTVALQNLHSLRAKAIDELGALLSSENETVRLKAACEVLNRTLAPMPLSPVVTDELQKRQRWDAVIQGLQKKSNETFQTGTEVECTLKQ